MIKTENAMKNISYFIIGTLAFIFFGMTACHKYEAVDVEQMYVAEDAAWTKTHTVAEFLNTYMTEFGTPSPSGDTLKYPPRARSYEGAVKTGKNLGLFSVDDIPDSVPVVIIGRIVSQDVAGNIYKTMYIQDCEHPEQGLKLSVDAGSLSGMYSIGQKIAINCAGLAVGKYAKMPQIGVPYYNNGKEGMDNPEKVGWEIGRIPMAIFQEHVQLIGKPDKSKIVVKDMTIADIKATADNYQSIALLTSRLVRINNVKFIPYTWDQKGKLSALSGSFSCGTDKDANTFAPTTEGKGFPQSRCFMLNGTTDTIANTLAIGTSEYAKFACAHLPEEEYIGSVTGMVSYYHDNGRYAVVNDKVWSIVINGLDALELKNSAHEKWAADPVYYPAY